MVYRVTTKGAKHFASTATTWRQIVGAVERALQGGEHGEPPWLDEVLSRLVKSGLPPSYVQRLAEELSDHIEDFTEEKHEHGS